MCPLCMSTVALLVAGTGGAGGVTALLVKKLRKGARRTRPVANKP